MSTRILLLRSGRPELPEEGARERDVDLLVTHEGRPVPEGIDEARAFPPRDATLAVTSLLTVDAILEGGAGGLFAGRWREVLAAGDATAAALREAGSVSVRVPAAPGAKGIVGALEAKASGLRLLWPHGADADPAPFDRLRERGALVCAPVVYEKRPLPSLDASLLRRLSEGAYGAVAVGSLAALDALLSALASEKRPLPPVRWGVLGPETARAFPARGLPPPAVPARPRIPDLLNLLRTGDRR